jgi:hypothetical protein
MATVEKTRRLGTKYIDLRFQAPCLAEDGISADGYERTFPLIKPMSAFPPKVDVAAFETDVHFRPNADIRCDKISV